MISVSNGLAENFDQKKLLERLQTLKSSSDDTVSAQAVAREGGSGFHKLRKILGSDLRCLNTFDFGLRCHRFVVDIVLDVVGWQ